MQQNLTMLNVVEISFLTHIKINNSHEFSVLLGSHFGQCSALLNFMSLVVGS